MPLTHDQITAVFSKHFETEEALDTAVGMLKVLLNKQIAAAQMGIADAQAAQAQQAAEGIRQQAQVAANQADAAFVAYVAAAAAA